ncbi:MULTISPECIES: carbohydrate ABC transporter permease [unclassified Paenibacillus]|uniref:carbohydrate ABC transporter permease n=1 Tax=unclassified Paenibacillus TaxID=185978 RepID=UPI00363ACF6D
MKYLNKEAVRQVYGQKPRSNKAFSLKRIFFSEKFAPYLFVAPFLLSFLIFFLYPTASTISMSFQEVHGLNSSKFIGLDNYRRMFDEHFFNALKTNTIYTILSLLLLIPIPIVFAVFLNSKLTKGKTLFKSIIFIPALTSVIVAGVSFRLMFGEADTAFINSVIAKFGISPQNWILNYSTGMMLMVILNTWRTAGINMVYYLAGLQSIPEELYESAEMDGASVFSKFYWITLPLLKPIIIYTLTIGIFEGYRMFGESYVFWNEGMPGDIGLTIVRFIYQQAFQRNDMGMGSAIGITLLLIVLTVNLVQLKMFGLFKKESE